MRIISFLGCLLFIVFFISCDLPTTENATQFNELGLKYSAEGNKEKAIKYFKKAANVRGVSDSARTVFLQNVGEEYWFDNVDSAKYYYSQAIRLQKRNSYNWYCDLANLHLLNRQIDNALFSLSKAYDIDSIDLAANNLIGLIYLGTYDKDYLDPERALKFNINAYNFYKDVHSESVLAQNYYLVNDLDKSVNLYEDLCQRAPNFDAYKSTLTMIYLEMGKKEKANTMLDELKLRDTLRYNKIINSNIKKGEHSLTWNAQ